MQTIYAFSYNPVIATGTNTTGTNWRMAYQQPIMLYKGTSNLFRLVVFSVKQKVVDLTNYGVQVQIVDKETKEHFVTKTATITTPTSGVATIEFTEADLRNLQHRFYHLIAKLIDPDDGSSVSSGEILYLDDNYGAFTPITIEDAWNYSPTAISTIDGEPNITFTNIGQTPDTFAGQAGKLLKVNANETGIEFSTSVNSLTIGNILFANSNITTSNTSINLRVASQILAFTDNSTDPAHNEGDGGFITFFDNTHINDGPRFEVWYGDPLLPGDDPPNQHSLDIRAPNQNSYVEFASQDLNTFMGVQNNQAFIQVDWLNDPTQGWRFNTDGTLRLSRQGKIESYDGNINLAISDGFFDINSIDASNVWHRTTFDKTGEVYFAGNLYPGSYVEPLATPEYSLGSPTRPWKDVYLSNSTIYLGDVALSVDQTGNLLVDGNVITGGGEGLPTVTIPGETGSTYKGLQVSYGMIHSNGSSSELNVNKIVIHKPAVTTTEIDPTGSQDFFKVSGLGNSDVLAMFVIYGDTNGPKSLTTLEAFAQAVIDNVILDGGVEGEYNTLADMKVAFYESYATLASAADGLDLDFEFYNSSTAVNTGTTTTRQGSGASFIINNVGDTTYSAGSGGGGTNYRVGHKILIPGTSLFGVSPDNDCIVTVTAVIDGAIDAYTVSGVAPGSTPNTSPLVSGTNYEVGSGFSVDAIYFTNLGAFNAFNLTSAGSNYVEGDVLTLLGSGIQDGTSPNNNITITVTTVDGSGAVTGYTATGNFPRIWPSNYISDGGNDQYDTANYINSSFDSSIPYNQGVTVADGIVDGIAVFGEGATFSFVYETGIFGLFVTGNKSTFISTSGNSGADGNSTTEAGNLYGPNTLSQTFDNAVTHINFVGDPWAGPIVSFTRPNNSAGTIDILIPDDGEGAGVAIARANNANGIYNPYREGSWDSDVSPGGTLWNTEGWNDLSDVTIRNYQNLYAAFGNGGLGNKIVGTECIMYLPDNGKYYAVKFDSWTQGGNGGGFAYTRREIDLNNLQEGIRFSDGTRLKSAVGIGRVKLESPGSRRIEEVYGYKQVGVSQKTVTNLTSVASRAVTGDNRIWIDSTATTIDNIIDIPSNYQVWDTSSFEFSLDDITYYKYTGSISFSGNEWGFSTDSNFTYNQGDTIYFRYSTGAQPVVWWNAADLPGGASNFRGAVIDYHAYTGNGTIVGTIHIVDDSGEKHISHTEVQSGSTDGENDDLWLVQNEGTISYRRIDGEAKILKIQWSAKVFYGLEFWD